MQLQTVFSQKKNGISWNRLTGPKELWAQHHKDSLALHKKIDYPETDYSLQQFRDKFS